MITKRSFLPERKQNKQKKTVTLCHSHAGKNSKAASSGALTHIRNFVF